VHAVLAGIALPNSASIGLHEAFGFTKVGQMREVGCKFGQWLDVGYWQLLLAPQR
jgi:L-amino acid N-acyltransferase YncA